MAYPLVQLVSAPSTSATLRLDLNPGGTSGRKVLNEGFSLGTPAVLGEALEDAQITYGNRTISFTVRVEGAKATALAQHSLIARELLRRTGWLKYQLSASTQPKWFRLFRAEPQDLGFTLVDNTTGHADLWDIAVTVPAEGLGYGAEVTQSVQTVNNDPASGTNPMRIALPAVTGDAPTPLKIKVNPSNSSIMGGYRWLLSMHSGDTQRLPVVWPIGTSDSFSVGADTGAGVSDSAYSGGSYRAVTFATQTALVDRITGNAPAALSPGRYKVLARIGRNDTTTTFSVRFGQGLDLVGTTGYFYGDTFQWDRAQTVTSTHTAWIDLGTFTFPRGVDPVDALSGTNATPNIALQVGRTGGTGQARLDCLMLVPIETPDTLAAQTLTDYFLIGIDVTDGVGVWDGNVERFYQINTSGVVTPSWHWMTGGFLYATPGAANVLTVLQQVNGQHQNIALGFALGSALDANDVITVSTDVTISYYPRWLWIGDS